MAIGYACKLIGVLGTDIKGCTQKSATPERLTELIAHNIESLDKIIEYNAKNHIHLFRISSDFIPFGSSPVNTLPWDNIFAEELAALGEKAQNQTIRLSMHPGQYTVINSPDPDVVSRSVEDLIYHARVLDAMNLPPSGKMVLHIGGGYGNKEAAIKRFKDVYQTLPETVKRRLIIENDDRIYTAQEVLGIALECEIPMVFDTLHNSVNSSLESKTESQWIALCNKTWKLEDGPQKIHYSQQAEGKRAGSHSDFISIDPFLTFYESVNSSDLDIMLEVKDKNLSCIKCVNCTTSPLPVRRLEEEWSRYKYTVLEKDPAAYQKIREFLKDKEKPSPLPLYHWIEQALLKEEDVGAMTNGFLHVWGYFKKKATDKEKADFFKAVTLYEAGEKTSPQVKKTLERLAKKYHSSYLLNSYYFDL